MNKLEELELTRNPRDQYEKYEELRSIATDALFFSSRVEAIE